MTGLLRQPCYNTPSLIERQSGNRATLPRGKQGDGTVLMIPRPEKVGPTLIRQRQKSRPGWTRTRRPPAGPVASTSISQANSCFPDSGGVSLAFSGTVAACDVIFDSPDALSERAKRLPVHQLHVCDALLWNADSDSSPSLQKSPSEPERFTQVHMHFKYTAPLQHRVHEGANRKNGLFTGSLSQSGRLKCHL